MGFRKNINYKVSLNSLNPQMSFLGDFEQERPVGMCYELERILIDATTDEVLFVSTDFDEVLAQAQVHSTTRLRLDSRCTGRFIPIAR
jgi:hypothetical protein